MNLLTPISETEVCDIVRAARADRRSLRIQGGATRAGLGRPVTADATLSTAALSGVTVYNPAELVMTARAGATILEIEAALAANNQMLPFEPMDHRALYGTGGEPTIGAVAACNISGPRRVKCGAARDSLIGLRLVNGAGEAIQCGGRVMKNVTGLDLVKLNCGAHGTLGVLTEVTFKVLPKPERTGTIMLEGLDDRLAIRAMSAALGSPFEVSAAAHMPGEGGRTLFRMEHFTSSVDYRLGELSTILAPFGSARLIGEAEALALWRDIRDGGPLKNSARPAVWRASMPPGRAVDFVAHVQETGALRDYFFDWGGGLVWLATDQRKKEHGAVHAAAARVKGHATLIRATDEARSCGDVFQPQARVVMELTARVKKSFDPDGIFNPGRMYAGV